MADFNNDTNEGQPNPSAQPSEAPQSSHSNPSSTEPTANYPEPNENNRVVPSEPWQAGPSNQYAQGNSWQPQHDPKEASDMSRTRSLASIGMILAIVSLVIGGVLLSTVALILGIIGYRTAARYAKTTQGQAQANWSMLQRSARITLILSICTLALNAISMMYLYPIMLDFLEMNGFGDMPIGSGSSGSGSTGSSVWG